MTLEEFVFNVPLYQKIKGDNGYGDIITSLIKQDQNTQLEGYNPIKKCDTTYYIYKGIGNLQKYSEYTNSRTGRDVVYDSFVFSAQLLADEGIRSLVLKCKRYGDTITVVVFHNPKDNLIMKVGQYPSDADIHLGQIKQYDKLGIPVLNELTRAIGLAANGVGIGSFVYLRRVFEYLIQDVFDEAKTYIDVESYIKQRMDEKLYTLRDYLPHFIVENRAVYGILSKGVHELSEDECLAYFDCMRSSIELILDERIEQMQKKKKEERVKKSINEISSKVSK